MAVRLLSLLIVFFVIPPDPPRPAGGPLIAHRGASAYAPEHTLESYRLALEQGADFVEQDLAVTKDGVLVCIHDTTLERTTDVEARFPSRFTEVNGDRRWFVNDFTLDEIRQLDAGGWFSETFAGARVPTFQEAIDLVRGKAGLYPELKDPGLYRSRDVDFVTLFVEAVPRNGLDRPVPGTPFVVQSFDADTLRALKTSLPEVPRVLLIEPRDAGPWTSAEGLREAAGFVQGIGPHKSLVAGDPALVQRAHAAGLTVTPYTFRSSSTGRFASVREEMTWFLRELKVDALFTDNPDQFPR